MRIATSIQVFSLLSVAYACDGHGNHAHTRRSVAPSTVTPPKSPLEWGDVNILHTTDTHGWLLGHQKKTSPEPNYGGDLGDFTSFVLRMKALAKEKKTKADFLLIDSGDLHDGTGITEGGLPDSVDGHDASEIFDDLPYDLLTIGNHELYSYNVASDVHENFAKKFPKKYLTSNVFIKPPGGPQVPIGDQVSYLKTENNRSVTAFGILFNFQSFDRKGDGEIIVKNPEDMVKDDWFKEAINKDTDLFVIPGHMPIGTKDSDNQWNVVRKAIRNVPKHQYTPIIILGGHSHIRNCEQNFRDGNASVTDKYTMALQSGRYMETVGWLSVKLPSTKSATEQPTFSRRYLDTNTVTYEYHTNLHGDHFVTELGKKVSKSLKALANKYLLSAVLGTSTKDYTLNQKKFEEEGNLVKLWIEEAVPYALKSDPSRKGTNDNIVVVANPNSLRFDLYSGPFTRNDQLSISYYTDKFLFLPNISLAIVNEVLSKLKPSTPTPNRRSLAEERELADDTGNVEERYGTWVQDMHRRYEVERRDLINATFAESDTLGYVTTDSCSTAVGDGDDTVHKALPYIKLPSIINSVVPTGVETVDLVFIDYVWNQRKAGNILQYLNVNGTKYKPEDAKVYSDIASNQAIAIYAQGNWNGN